MNCTIKLQIKSNVYDFYVKIWLLVHEMVLVFGITFGNFGEKKTYKITKWQMYRLHVKVTR